MVSNVKQDCYIFNGEKWIKYSVYVENKRYNSYNFKAQNPVTAVLGSATLGTMKLGEGN